MWFKELNGIGDTAQNLGAAADGENYEWTRPQIDVKIKDLDLDDTMGLMLKKEMVFDRLAITDFELEKQHDGQIRYIPVCPRCGKRRN